MLVEFGEGKVSVTTAGHGEVAEKSTMLVIEPGKGTGVINGIPQDRKKGVVFDLQEFIDSPEKIVFKFANSKSVDVVIRALVIIRDDFSKTRQI